MSVVRTILFPFEIQGKFFDGYAWAVELANRMHAKLQLFTTKDRKGNDAIPGNDLFQILLEAQGHYLQYYHHEDRRSTESRPEPIIVTGDLKEALINYLDDNRVDILIVDASLQADRKQIREITAHASAAIVLPKSARGLRGIPRSDRFLDTLRRAELHRLPDNFFDTLGQDRSVFNYLRKLFQGNQSS